VLAKTFAGMVLHCGYRQTPIIPFRVLAISKTGPEPGDVQKILIPHVNCVLFMWFGNILTLIP